MGVEGFHTTNSMKKKIVKKKINGKIWKIQFGHAGKTDGVDNDGICDYETRTIFINPKSGRSFINVLSHELLHARFPDLEEDAIEEMGTLIEDVYYEMCEITFDTNTQTK
jgi:hypothetical protein